MKFPGPEDRAVILGRTGSGKTTFGLWLLSGKDFNAQPWVIFNTKGDRLINEIGRLPGVKTLDINETPGEKGLFIYNPLPEQQEEIEASIRRIWDKQNCGVFIDEGYMIEEDKSLNSVLTQGRSRRVPVIICSQRPVWITKYAFSETDYVAVFHLTHEGDRKNTKQFVPFDVNTRLPKHCCFWYEVGEDRLYKLSPINPSNIIRNFSRAFPPEGESIPGAASPEIVEQETVVRRKKVI